MIPKPAEQCNNLIFKAIIDEQGTFTAQLPEYLRGQTVMITVHVAAPAPQETLFDLFAQTDMLVFPRRNHDEILEELHHIRGSYCLNQDFQNNGLMVRIK